MGNFLPKKGQCRCGQTQFIVNSPPPLLPWHVTVRDVNA